MKLCAVLLMIFGLLIFESARKKPIYADEEKFHEQYMKLNHDSVAYGKLRNKYLTSAPLHQDYGLTIASLGLAMLAYTTTLRRSPRARWVFYVLVILASTLFCAAVIGSVVWDYERGVYPHWADSIAIPIFVTPVIGIFLSLWGLAHCLFLWKKWRPSVNIFSVPLNQWNPWLGLMVVLTTAWLVYSSLAGDFWSILPSSLWLYFYLSLNAARQRSKMQLDLGLKFSKTGALQ